MNARPELPNRRRLVIWLLIPALVVLIAGGLYLVLHMWAGSSNRGSLVPVDLRSVLTPDYGIDLTPVEVPQVDEGIINSALNDQPTLTNDANLAATLAGGLQIPVPTVTVIPTLLFTPPSMKDETPGATQTPSTPTATRFAPSSTLTQTAEPPTATARPPDDRTRTDSPVSSRTPTYLSTQAHTPSPTLTPTYSGPYPPPEPTGTLPLPTPTLTPVPTEIRTPTSAGSTSYP